MQQPGVDQGEDDQDVGEHVSAGEFLLTVPETIWEASFGIYCTFRGFRRVPGFFADTEHAHGVTPLVAAR